MHLLSILVRILLTKVQVKFPQTKLMRIVILFVFNYRKTTIQYLLFMNGAVTFSICQDSSYLFALYFVVTQREGQRKDASTSE